MADAILTLNAGSSSLKFSAFHNSEPPELLLQGQIEGLQTKPQFIARSRSGTVIDRQAWPDGSTLQHHNAIEFLFDWIQRQLPNQYSLVAAGHRVVHGGTRLTRPVLIDGDVLSELEALAPLAPLHQPHNIAAIRAVAENNPQLCQVACFDTSFHRTQSAVAQEYAIPRSLTESGIYRYGFHGLSYEYIALQLPQIDPRGAGGRTIVAHLGNGASLCALDHGVSVGTTMGFTPLDGLVMGTRCGAIDPGVLIYLMKERGLDVFALERLLTHESGLLGVSGVSSDMRTLLEQEPTNANAAKAIELFVDRVVRQMGSLVAAMGGLDCLVFTGGIGEHAAPIRSRICQAWKWMEVEIDEDRNREGGPRISRANAGISVLVIPTNEELMIAMHTQQLLKTIAS